MEWEGLRMKEKKGNERRKKEKQTQRRGIKWKHWEDNPTIMAYAAASGNVEC